MQQDYNETFLQAVFDATDSVQIFAYYDETERIVKKITAIIGEMREEKEGDGSEYDPDATNEETFLDDSDAQWPADQL